ncbi:MAG: DegV family protein [Ruminococcaceae bacterium]|nr:DegV family protein [Oscillospiraceae bacterium]
MHTTFQLSCESTVDFPYSHMAERNIPVLFYTYTLEEQEYEDDMLRDPNALPRFFAQLKTGAKPSTSQINVSRYLSFFEPLLEKGDLLHIAFGTGMTPSYYNACRAAEALREKYPERKLVVIDSLCSCIGYGMLTDLAADLRDSGCTLEETAKHIADMRLHVHHQFFSTDLTQFRRSGRVSGPAATVGTLLNICPLMHLDRAGKIIAYSKIRGIRQVIAATVDTVVANSTPSTNIYRIGHSQCRELAQQTADALRQRAGDVPIEIMDIGTIISAHCGPGTVAVFFFGKNRE